MPEKERRTGEKTKSAKNTGKKRIQSTKSMQKQVAIKCKVRLSAVFDILFIKMRMPYLGILILNGEADVMERMDELASASTSVVISTSKTITTAAKD